MCPSQWLLISFIDGAVEIFDSKDEAIERLEGFHSEGKTHSLESYQLIQCHGVQLLGLERGIKVIYE
jgi:hypothetical protein